MRCWMMAAAVVDFLEYHARYPQDADAKKKHGFYQTKKKTTVAMPGLEPM